MSSPRLHLPAARRARWARLLLAWLLPALASTAFGATPQAADVPLVIGNRTIHVFRAALGDISAEERAQAARRHIEAAFLAEGEGWTSTLLSDNGVIVALDGKPMFTVTPGDTSTESGETPDSLANTASRVLQKVWAENRESRDSNAVSGAVLRVVVAFAILAGVLWLLVRLSGLVRQTIANRLGGRVGSLVTTAVGWHSALAFRRLAARAGLGLMWLLGLAAVFAFLAYSLDRFPLTRPVSESIVGSLDGAIFSGLRAAAETIPGLIVAILIFMIARIVTLASRGMFDRIAAGHLRLGALDAQTAPATRYLVNAAIWLFAVAMSYPYLPGSHTEAFKGLSVLLGVMVSIGASGLIGQVASGMILVYTRALLVGEYVQVQGHEGMVTHIGLFVTRLRTGTGEEIALPNHLVVNNVTRNFSRTSDAGGSILHAGVTIGYDAPWRQVHAMLLEAARQVPGLSREPAPFVIQSGLSDFYVAYRLVVHVDAAAVERRPQVQGELNAAIQDVFNRYGVQIMSPHYVTDPAKAKTVPPAQWHRDPAPPQAGA